MATRYRDGLPKFSGIFGEARVDQRGERGRIRGSVLMFVRRGGQVRFDVMTQFGPAMTLTSDGERFALADFQEQRFLTGPTCAANIARLLRMPLTARQVSQVLLGEAPEITAVKRQLRWQADAGRYRLSETSPKGYVQQLDLQVDDRDLEKPLAQQRFWLRAVRLLAPHGGEVWRIAYDEHRLVSNSKSAVMLPFEVHVIQDSSDSDTLVKFRNIAINPDVDDAAFHQRIPSGMTPEEAPCE